MSQTATFNVDNLDHFAGFAQRRTTSDTLSQILSGPASFGGNSSNGTTTLVYDSAAGGYSINERTFYSFNTSSLGANAVVLSATLRVRSLSGAANLQGMSDYSVVPSTHSGSLAVSAYNKITRTALSSASLTPPSDRTDAHTVTSQVDTTGRTNLALLLEWDFDEADDGSPVNGASQVTTRTSTSAFSADGTVFNDLTVEYYLSLPASVDDDIEFTSTIDPTVILVSSVDSDIEFTSEERATVLPATDIEKTYLYKVYDLDDNYIGIWSDVQTDPTYTQRINEVGAAHDVVFARSAERKKTETEILNTEGAEDLTTEDTESIQAVTQTTATIGAGTDIDLGYRVELVVYYGTIEQLLTEGGEVITTEGGDELLAQIGAPNGRVVFNGRIVSYTSRYGTTDFVKARLFSFGYELNNVLVDGSDTEISYASVDPSAIITDVLDKYAGTITYDSDTVINTGTTVSYDFNLVTAQEAIQKALELSPSSEEWYYYVDLGTNKLFFNKKSTTPDHTLVLGRDIANLDVSSTIENMVNQVYFVGQDSGAGNLFKKYSDATSIAKWGNYDKPISDLRVSDTTSAEYISEFDIDRLKDPRNSSICTVSPANYAIESIKLGQSIGFANFNNYIDDIVLQVVALEYSPYTIKLTLDYELPTMRNRIEDISRNQKRSETLDLGSAPS